MEDVKRYNLVLPDNQFADVKRVAGDESVAEAIRQAIRLYVKIRDGRVRVYTVDKDGVEREAILI